MRLLHKSNSSLTKRDGSPKGKEWIGRYGEFVVTSYLRAQGVKVLRQNFRWGSSGELDIVCRDGDLLRFIEVKTRSSTMFSPARAVSLAKRKLIRKGASHWLRLLRRKVSYQFDIAEVILQHGKPPQINILQNAFQMKEPVKNKYHSIF